jgi:hypothetical protein
MSAADVRVVRAAFDEVAGALNLEMKGWQGGGAQLDVLGLSVDLSAHRASPTASTIQTLREVPDLLLRDVSRSRVSNAEFLQFMGTAQWVCYSTARVPPCFFPGVMNTLRRICTLEDWSGTTTAVGSEFAVGLRRLAHVCATVVRGPRPTTAESTRNEIWSDASTEALAAVCPRQRRAFTQPVACTHREMVYAEMLAGLLGFNAFSEGDDTWVCDNQAACRAMIRGHSGSPACDALLRAWIASGRAPRLVMWVDTDCNIADGLTRAASCSQPDDRAFRAPHMLCRVRWEREGVEVLQNTHARCQFNPLSPSLQVNRTLACVEQETIKTMNVTEMAVCVSMCAHGNRQHRGKQNVFQNDHAHAHTREVMRRRAPSHPRLCTEDASPLPRSEVIPFWVIDLDFPRYLERKATQRSPVARCRLSFSL